MSYGERRHIITIQARSTTIDEYGGPAYGWSDHVKVWAKYRPLRGRELIAGKAAQSEVSAMFYTMYLPSVTTAMRIMHNGNVFDIESVINVDGLNRELEITATTGVNQG